MTFNIKVSLGADDPDLLNRQTDINLYDTMALRTGQVMMMRTTADSVVMGPIPKLNTIQETHIHQHLDRTIDRCATQARLTIAQLLPEIINREIRSACRVFYQPLSNELTWTCMTLTGFIKCGTDFIRNHVCLAFLLS
jgi:hypothetical protein